MQKQKKTKPAVICRLLGCFFQEEREPCGCAIQQRTGSCQHLLLPPVVIQQRNWRNFCLHWSICTSKVVVPAFLGDRDRLVNSPCLEVRAGGVRVRSLSPYVVQQKGEKTNLGLMDLLFHTLKYFSISHSLNLLSITWWNPYHESSEGIKQFNRVPLQV